MLKSLEDYSTSPSNGYPLKGHMYEEKYSSLKQIHRSVSYVPSQFTVFLGPLVANMSPSDKLKVDVRIPSNGYPLKGHRYEEKYYSQYVCMEP